LETRTASIGERSDVFALVDDDRFAYE